MTTEFQAMRRRRARGGQAGFSLTEIMVAILIIGLLATVVVVNVFPLITQGRTTAATANIKQLRGAVTNYHLTFGRYPDSLQDLVVPPANVRNASAWPEGGFIDGGELPLDPWSQEFQYARPGARGPFDVYSLGADGLPGGEGDDADIYGDRRDDAR